MRCKIVRFQKLIWRNMMRSTKSQKASVLHYSIDMINIRVLLIIRVLIILKYFGDLDFECYMCVWRNMMRSTKSQKASVLHYNIDMINIRVLLIIRVLIILKYFGDLDFECYVCVCGLGFDCYIYIYI